MGTQNIFLSPTLMRRRKTSLSISLPSQTVNNGERLLSFPISSLVTAPKQLILRWFCDLSASYRGKKRRKQNTTHKVIDKKQNKTKQNKIKKNKQTKRKQVTRVEF